MRLVASAMIESLQSHRFKRDVERIAAVGPAYVAVVIEAIGTDLDRVDEVRRIVQEFSEIIPDPGCGPEPTHPEAA